MVLCLSDPPSVTASDSVIVVNQTDPASFSCLAYGIPAPSLTWFSSIDPSRTIQNEAGVLSISFTSNLTVNMSTLAISEAYRSEHEANYTCIAENGVPNFISTPESATVELIVQGMKRLIHKLITTVVQDIQLLKKIVLLCI